MILLRIWFCLWSSLYVFAPPSLDINHSRSLESFTRINTHLSNVNPVKLIKQRKIKGNRTIITNNQQTFGLESYRSSWKFVDKYTIRVRFRLQETLVQSIVSTRFLVRHIHTGDIRTYDKPHDTINSTLTLYLHNIKHGRHTVCLLIYTSKRITNPSYIFCQDVVFNFHKYGLHDIDSDEHKNTFFFLLTQYAIVSGLLCIFQVVHAARKRRFLAAVYDKANAFRHHMMEHHHFSHENKSTPELNHRSQTLEYLIYNLNRNALDNFDRMYMPATNDDGINLIKNSPIINPQRTEYQKYLKLPTRLDDYSTTPLVRRRRSLVTNDNLDLDEENLVESDFDTRSYEEQSTSYKSVSHILEANKPWVTKLTDNGSIKHSIVITEPSPNTQIIHL